MDKIDINSYLVHMRNMGGVIFFIDNENIMKNAIEQDDHFLNYCIYFTGRPYNNFNYFFLRHLERSIIIDLSKTDHFNYGKFISMAHKQLKESYNNNVYGTEKEIWSTNGKSIDLTITRILKNFDPDYVVHLYKNNYVQLANLFFDFYFYYPFIGDEKAFAKFWNKYLTFIQNDWQETLDIEGITNWIY
jgi:hypothetical protein